MAKRFTGTEKWDDPFFSELSMKEKLVWIFLLDKCNHAGIWDVNQRSLDFNVGEHVDIPALLVKFSERIQVLENGKWFIKKFIEFQYGELNEANRAHQSVISILKKEGAYKGLVSPIQGAKDKDKDKDKDKEMDMGGAGGVEIEESILESQPKNWNQNPKPDDVPELPELKLRSAAQLLYHTKRMNVPDQTILGLFSVFRNQHLTGKKFYQTRDDVYSHFLNWIRNQPITDATANTKNNGKSAGLKSFMEELQRESGFNPIRSGDPGG